MNSVKVRIDVPSSNPKNPPTSAVRASKSYIHDFSTNSTSGSVKTNDCCNTRKCLNQNKIECVTMDKKYELAYIVASNSTLQINSF